MNEPNSRNEQLLEDIQLGKYLAILRRRRRWMVVTATAVFVAVGVFALLLPNTYHAETVILVDPQKVPDSVVPATVNTTVGDRLSTIRQEVMSPTRLRQLIIDSNLYAEETAKDGVDRVVERMQRSILLEVGEAGGSRLSAFRIGYTAKSPEEAALVPNQLAKMVIQNNVRAREAQSSSTAEFLESELQDTKKQLEQKETEMGRIKSTYIMDLPESKQFHLEALTSLRNQLGASQDHVSRAEQEKVYLQSVTATQNPTVDLDADGPDSMVSSPEQVQEQKLEARLAELRGRYGPGHPDVRKTQGEIEKLKAKIAEQKANQPPVTESPRRAPRRPTKNPVVEAQLNKIDQEIKEQTELQKDLQRQIDFHSGKLEREPIFEQQMAGLMRDYDTLRAHYNHLLDKKLSADMYTSLVNHEEGEHFTILDSAQVPRKPSGPNRFLFSLAGLLGGLVAGLGLAIAKEMTDSTVRDEEEVSGILGKPVMAGIPVIVPPREARLRRVRVAAILTATVVSASALGFLLSVVMRRFA